MVKALNIAAAALGGVLVLSSTPLWAQDEARQPTPSALVRQPQRAPAPTQGVQIGGFTVSPSMVFSEYYDDNIYATDQDKVHDYVTLLTPSISANSKWNRHALNFDAGAEIARYGKNSTENTQDYWFNGDGRYDISARSNLFAGAGISRSHEDRVTPVGYFGTEPTRYLETNAHVGGFHRFDKLSLRIAATLKRLNYRDVPSLTGEINNDDRDRKDRGVGARAGYRVSRDFELYAQATSESRDYQSAVDNFGFDRTSKGYAADAGLVWTQPGKLRADVYAGRLRQKYDDARFADVSKPDFGLRFAWLAVSQLTVSAYADRSVEETTLIGSSGYLYSVGGLQADYRLPAQWVLNASLMSASADYQDISRTDDYRGAGFGVTKSLVPGMALIIDYQYLKRDSSVATDNFKRNQLFLTVKGRL